MDRRKRAAPRRVAAEGAAAEGELDRRLLRRVVVEGLHPEIDGGRFPVKRTVGEEVVVGAAVSARGGERMA